MAATQIRFSKYPKMLEDTFKAPQGAKVSKASKWVVTEKVHGANFSVIVSPSGDVHFAKRTAVLDEKDDFYSFRSAGLADALRFLAPKVVEHLAKELPSGERLRQCPVHIFGELCGGHYPHPDTPSVEGLQPVQMGVWYSPKIEFIGFDVAISVPGVQEDIEFEWIDWEMASKVCRASGMHFIPALAKGSLSECLGFNNRFTSRIATELFSLPSLESDEDSVNLSEGVVVRPLHEIDPSGKCRGLFKRKIEEFAESKVYRNDDWKKGKEGGAGRSKGSASEEEIVKFEIMSLITPQRVDNTLSKIGRVVLGDKKACRELLDAYKEDVIQSLAESDQLVVRRSVLLQAILEDEGKAAVIQRLRQIAKGV